MGKCVKKNKAEQVSRYFRGELMKVGIKFDYGTEKLNTSDRIEGVDTEGEKV